MLNLLIVLKKISEKISGNLLARFPRPHYCLVGTTDIAVPPLEVMFIQGELVHELAELCTNNAGRKFSACLGES